MRCSKLKGRAHPLNSGVGKCPCGQTFDHTSKRDQDMKYWMHCKVCPSPPEGHNYIRTPKKTMMLRKKQQDEAEKMKRVHDHHNNIYPNWIDISLQKSDEKQKNWLRPYDVIVVIALAWVFGARLLTQRSDDPLTIQTEVSNIIFKTTGGKCLEVCSILINQVNDHRTSYFSAYLLNTLYLIDNLSWHFSPLKDVIMWNFVLIKLL